MSLAIFCVKCSQHISDLFIFKVVSREFTCVCLRKRGEWDIVLWRNNDIRELKQTTTTTATGMSPNKRFNEQNNSCARAL